MTRPTPERQYIAPADVPGEFGISWATVLRWEDRNLIKVHRPSSRKSLVKCADLAKVIEGMK